MYKKKRNYNENKTEFTTLIPKDGVKPEKGTEILPRSALLGAKTLKGLPKSGSSITLKADPYSIALPDSDPYAIFAAANPKAGGKYGGSENTDGGITEQLSQSQDSALLHAFDTFLLRPKLNYRYLPMTHADVVNGRGAGYAKEMLRAIDEVISVAKATTFTTLAINNYYIKTNLPIPDNNYNLTDVVLDQATAQERSDYLREHGTEYSLGTPEGLYALLINYQIRLQDAAQVVNIYNKFRANQGVMMRSCWNRETPRLNSRFAQLNKAAVVGVIKSLVLAINGEYFDVDWMRQVNMLSSLSSRKTNGMLDPILEIAGTHICPHFVLYLKPTTEGGANTVLYDSILREADALGLSDNPNVSSCADINALVTKLAYRLSVNDMLYNVRNNSAYAAMSDADILNLLVDSVKTINALFGRFKPAMGDLRTMLDVLHRVGANKWSKEIQLSVLTDNDVPIMDNLTVNDLYKTLLSGAKTVVWDENTFKWTLFTQWNYYKGIPEYDDYSGGAFLSFCTRDLIGNHTLSTFAKAYLPQLITEYITTADDSPVSAVNRLGVAVAIHDTSFDPAINRSTARLKPLSSISSLEIKVPYTNTTLSAIDESFLQAACLKVFDFYCKDAEVSATTDLAVNPDLLFYIPVQINDLQNEMITYARVNGPFVVNESKESNIGFLGL